MSESKIRNFYYKWNTVLYDADDNIYDLYQNAFFRALKSMCNDLDANIVVKNKGYYYESAIIERNGHYAYVCHSSEPISGAISLIHTNPFLIRSAKSEKDYKGGINYFADWMGLKNKINEILANEYEPRCD